MAASSPEVKTGLLNKFKEMIKRKSSNDSDEDKKNAAEGAGNNLNSPSSASSKSSDILALPFYFDATEKQTAKDDGPVRRRTNSSGSDRDDTQNNHWDLMIASRANPTFIKNALIEFFRKKQFLVQQDSELTQYDDRIDAPPANDYRIHVTPRTSEHFPFIIQLFHGYQNPTFDTTLSGDIPLASMQNVPYIIKFSLKDNDLYKKRKFTYLKAMLSEAKVALSDALNIAGKTTDVPSILGDSAIEMMKELHASFGELRALVIQYNQSPTVMLREEIKAQKQNLNESLEIHFPTVSVCETSRKATTALPRPPLPTPPAKPATSAMQTSSTVREKPVESATKPIASKPVTDGSANGHASPPPLPKLPTPPAKSATPANKAIAAKPVAESSKDHASSPPPLPKPPLKFSANKSADVIPVGSGSSVTQKSVVIKP